MTLGIKLLLCEVLMHILLMHTCSLLLENMIKQLKTS